MLLRVDAPVRNPCGFDVASPTSWGASDAGPERRYPAAMQSALRVPMSGEDRFDTARAFTSALADNEVPLAAPQFSSEAQEQLVA